MQMRKMKIIIIKLRKFKKNKRMKMKINKKIIICNKMKSPLKAVVGLLRFIN